MSAGCKGCNARNISLDLLWASYVVESLTRVVLAMRSNEQEVRCDPHPLWDRYERCHAASPATVIIEMNFAQQIHDPCSVWCSAGSLQSPQDRHGRQTFASCSSSAPRSSLADVETSSLPAGSWVSSHSSSSSTLTFTSEWDTAPSSNSRIVCRMRYPRVLGMRMIQT